MVEQSKDIVVEPLAGSGPVAPGVVLGSRAAIATAGLLIHASVAFLDFQDRATVTFPLVVVQPGVLTSKEMTSGRPAGELRGVVTGVPVRPEPPPLPPVPGRGEAVEPGVEP